MFDAFITFQSRIRPRAPAVITPNRIVSYAEFDADVDRLAGGLRRLGLTPADGIVSLQLTDPYLKQLALVALCRLGIVSSAGQDERADLRLVDGDWESAPRPVLLTADWLATTLAAEPAPLEPVRWPAEALVRVMLCSGTTRAPRRVAVTGRMLEGNIRSALGSYGAGKHGAWVALTGVDSILGITATIAAWSVGAAVVAGFTPEILAPRLERLHPTLVAMTPVYLRALLRLLPPDFAVQPQLRLVLAGGPLTRALAQEARLRLSPDVLAAYGATECSVATMAPAAVLERTPGVAGYAAPGVRVEVVDAAGQPLSAGVQGEVRLSGDRVASVYLDDPQESARAFRDGGFYPGDLGRLLPDGLLLIDGRVDDRMNLGGAKFLPNLLDEVALSCPGVVDAAAFAAPDAQGLDECWLAVVRGEDFQRARLVELIASHGDVFPPVRFAWIDEIPRNGMGKVDRRRLRADTLAALGLTAEGSATSTPPS